MSKTTEFLDELDDYELAFFAKFKLSTYMKVTKSKINDYLVERNLNKSKIEQLISENPKSKLEDDLKRCPRCYSDKIRKNKVEWTNTNSGIGLEDEIAIADGIEGKATYKYELICDVCDLWLEDPNEEKTNPISNKIMNGIWNIISRIFSK